MKNDIKKEENQKIEKPLITGSFEGLTIERQELGDFETFVFSSAQNNTHVHKPFLAALENYCKINNARLIIGKFTYNKNAFQHSTTKDEGIYYDQAIKKYLSDKQAIISENKLVWCGELNILPTAKYPLTGLEQYTGGASCIVPHAKIAMESVATSKHAPCKAMYSTGTITKRNYIAKKAGQMADAAHCFGALVVQVDKKTGTFFARQIETDESGDFQDLNTIYTPTGAKNARIEAISWGDIHAEKSDNKVLSACFDAGGMLDTLQPRASILHDLFDFSHRNHHNRQDSHFLAAEHASGESVSRNLKQAGKVLSMIEREYSETYVVESNHDLALNLWLKSNSYDFRTDPLNSLVYLELNAYIYRCIERGEEPRVLEHALCGHQRKNRPNTHFLVTDDDLIIKGIQCGQHGHNGVNGSRGNPKTFLKLNIPMITGHTHTAGIVGGKNGVYTGGVTGSLDMGYNIGGSSWSHSHVLIYETGKRAIVTMNLINNKWEWKI